MLRYLTLSPALTALLLSTVVSIAEGATTHINRDIHARHSILPRQQNTNRLPIVAAQCSEFCDPVNALVLTGCPGSSCCTDGFVTNFNNCAICIQDDAGSSDFGGAQTFFNHWSGLCDARGKPVKPVTIGKPDQPAPPANTSPTPPPAQPTSATPTPTPTPDKTTSSSSSSASTTSTAKTTATGTESTTATSTGTSSVPDAAGPPSSGATGVSDPGSSGADAGAAGAAGAGALRTGNGDVSILAGQGAGYARLWTFLLIAWALM